MRQLTYTGPNTLEWLDVPEPKLEGPGEALVRPMVVARCDLDPLIMAGATPMPPPIAIGHEFVAEVVEVGEDVHSVQPGQTVIVPFQISCGSCARCAIGATAMCNGIAVGSAYGFGAISGNFGGALSDLVRVPFADAMLLGLPEGVSPEAAASADNIPDAWRCVGPFLSDGTKAPVLIVAGGAVSISLYAAAIAVAMGSPQVDYIDTDRERLQLAESLGATAIEGPPPKRAGEYPITVDGSANLDGLYCAIRSTAPEGVCTSIGIYFGETTPLPLFAMFNRGITFKTGRVSARTALPPMIELIQSGRIQPEKFITKRVAWADAGEEYAAPAIKLIVTR